jgi:hypothetical protein
MKRWLLPVLLLLLWSSAVYAQDTTDLTVSYGVPVEGELSDQRTDQVWLLTTESADRIAVVVERLTGTLLPEIAVRGIDGAVLATVGQDPSGAIARIDRHDLTAAGSFQIVVQRQDSATGVSEGRYRLRVDLLSAPADASANQSVVGSIQVGQVVAGEITPDHWYQRYSFSAATADAIRIEAQRTSGGLQPQIEVLDAAGTQVAYGWGEWDGLSATIDRFELPAAGEYTIAVLRGGGFDGGTLGSYTLSITLLGAGEDSDALTSRTPAAVRYDVPARGTIDALWYEDWVLSAPSADVITISAASDFAPGSTLPTLVPEVLLLDSTGAEIAGAGSDGSGTQASIQRYALPAGGEYTIRVTRWGRKTGGTTGPYTLLVSVHGFGADNPALTEATGSMRMGAAVTGQIDTLWENRWQFDGRAGQLVDIRAERISGTLYPLLELLDPDGEVIGGAWYDASRSVSEMLGYTLPADGTYTIRIRREGDQGGWTRGEYRLSLQQQQ